MTKDKRPPPPAEAQAKLGEIMELLAVLESKVRGEWSVDTDQVVDIINILRAKLITLLARK